MRITRKMMDPELRTTGTIARMLFRPSRWLFRLVNRLSEREAGKNIDGLDCDEIRIPRSGDGTGIRVRIYKPPQVTKELPVLLYLHGGGYFMGTPESFSDFYRLAIKTRDCVIVAPAYRKSMEAPYPAAIDDCYDTLLWIRDNAHSLQARTDQIMVGGHSAGGGLTASLSLRARDRGEVNIAFQMPVYPMIDDRMATESATDNDAPMWNSKLNALAWDLYLKDLKDRDEPIPYDAAPARAEDYSNLPPTMTLVGDLDPFRDETVEYVENLKNAGVPVDFKVFEGCYHGFDLIAPNSAVGSQALNFTLQSFAEAVDSRFAPQTAESEHNPQHAPAS